MADFFRMLSWSPSWWDLLLIVSYAFVLISVPSVLVEREGNPYSALTWILALFAMPAVGLFFWWAFGRKHLVRKRRRRRKASAHVWRSLAQVRDGIDDVPYASLAGVLPLKLPKDEASWVFPPTASNRVELLNDAAEFYPAIEAAIRDARDHVHLLFYIWNDDATGARFRDLLVERATSGVDVRVLCDAFGSPRVRGSFMDPLRAAGGKISVFLPPKYFTRSPALNFRNHRKIVVVDGRVGFVGGLNIGDEYSRDWRDVAISIRGPAVDQLQEVFVDDWFFASGEDITHARYFGKWRDDPTSANSTDIEKSRVKPDAESTADSVPDSALGSAKTRRKRIADSAADATCAVVASGPHTTNNSLHDALFISITRAQKRIYITTPYFIPDQAIVTALRTAVYRGVDVRVLLPAKTDAPLVRLAARSYYSHLLQAGVRLYEYQPTILHVKSLLFDEDISVVGSANMDLRSFKLNFEATCFIQSRTLAARMAEVFQRDLRVSREVTLEEMANRTRWTKVTEAAAHLFSPMM
ncbi:MAG: phospholipase D-like domain-containing protein [Pirellulales bacterium]